MNARNPWSDFLGEINQACLAVACRRPGDPVNAGREPWFRGQNRSSHGLLPSLFRKPYADPDGADKPHIQWVESEIVSDGPDGTKLDYGQTICQWNGVHWDEPISLYPRQKTDRMHMQCGWFTVHGNRHVAIDELPGSSDFCTQVRLPAAALPAARTFLEQAGINRRTLFPDMQNLAIHFREQFGLLHGAEPRRRPESIASPESSQIQSSAARCI